MTYRLLAPAVLCLITSFVSAEPTSDDINSYFNPGPDAFMDLDAFVDLNHQSDMADNASVVNLEVDFDYLQQDIDNQIEFGANADLQITKDDGTDLDFLLDYEQRTYATSPDSIVGLLGNAFQFIDSGTADPRSFWFAGASLGSRSDLLADENVSTLGVFAGIGRGRIYANRALHKAWSLTQYLSNSGRLVQNATTLQLHDLAKIIDDWFKSARAAADEAHNLPKLESLRRGTYHRQWFEEIWQYMQMQGLVSGAPDLAAVFDMHDALNFRSYSTKWAGGAEIQFGLEVTSSSEDLEDNGFNQNYCDRVLIGVNDELCGTHIGMLLSYEQAWPIDIRSQFSANAAARFDFDADAIIGVGVGYLMELNEYLLWDTTLNAQVLAFDDTQSTIVLGSSLEYELSESSSLITSLGATVDDDGDFDHLLTVKLAFDLM